MPALARCSLLLLACGVAGRAHAQPHPVMTWIPPYAVAACSARLQESFEGQPISRGLSHLGLQFWTPTRAGGIELVEKFGPITPAQISKLRDWGHLHGVQVLLCVFNGVNHWDWSLARAGFAEHPNEFAEALSREV